MAFASQAAGDYERAYVTWISAMGYPKPITNANGAPDNVAGRAPCSALNLLYNQRKPSRLSEAIQRNHPAIIPNPSDLNRALTVVVMPHSVNENGSHCWEKQIRKGVTHGVVTLGVESGPALCGPT